MALGLTAPAAFFCFAGAAAALCEAVGTRRPPRIVRFVNAGVTFFVFLVVFADFLAGCGFFFGAASVAARRLLLRVGAVFGLAFGAAALPLPLLLARPPPRVAFGVGALAAAAAERPRLDFTISFCVLPTPPCLVFAALPAACVFADFLRAEGTCQASCPRGPPASILRLNSLMSD